jgi:cytidylate kinase
MAIITISREMASEGDETALELAKLLDFHFVDKHSLEGRIKSYGLTGPQFDRYDERKQGLFASMSQDRDIYLHYLKSAMLSEAETGNTVFIGRGASAIFHGLPAVLSVFLTASPEVRLERIKRYFHCDEKKAKQIISQSDRHRSGFHADFFDVEWRSPSNYHLTLNTAFLSPEVCAEIIKNLYTRIITPEVEALHALRLKEIALGHAIANHILYEKGVAVHFLEAQVSAEKVELLGVANSKALVEAAVLAAKEVSNGLPVESDIQIVQEYNVLIS